MHARKIIVSQNFKHMPTLYQRTTLLIHILHIKEVPIDVWKRGNETNEHGEDVVRWGVIPMQFPFITYGMELYINDSIPTNTNIEQMYVYASERSERA